MFLRLLFSKRNNNKRKRPWVCKNCGKEHGGKCNEPAKCFNCGKVGHIKRDCTAPAKEQPKNNNQADKGKAKLMAIAVEQDDAEDRVVRGTILINKFKIHVLFDSGCTHSFIAHRLVKKLELLISTLPYPIIVTATKGVPEYTTLGVKKLEFGIQGETYV